MPDGPTLQLEREIRFALVMYGGVSLAVYINGVAQEFYRLVRATAEDSGGQPLPLAEEDSVYRQIAQILSASGVDRNIDATTKIDGSLPIRTRFVVDILSGTSAGGLNSLFLAKALANGQEFSVLQDLWVNQADIAALLNDRQSTANPPSGFSLRRQDPPQSLLNSERMYALLLDALDEMDRLPPKDKPALVDEVDLFVTTTDLRGVAIQVQLADKVVPERRFRSVFHFRRSTLLPKLPPPGEAHPEDPLPPPRNDFESKFNPFLAFTGRCTSAFPVAFEPMRLKDIEPVLDRSSTWSPLRLSSTSQDWQPFLVEYVEEDGPLSTHPERFPFRAFADGGYLNNKPFSYAIEELGIRGGDLPYERKLVYIEPSPERINPEPAAVEKPDFIENSLDAAFTLPRYQTIREDLASVTNRNHLVRKIKNIVEELENDIDSNPAFLDNWVPSSKEDYSATPLSKFIAERGALYAAYHRLKVKGVTQEIARFLVSALALDDSADNLRAAYYMVWAWRDGAFSAELSSRPELESCFLSRYDLSYRERRIYFVLGRLDVLYALREDADRVVTAARLDGSALDTKRANPDDFRSEIRLLRGNRKTKDKPGLVNMLSNFRLCRNEWLERGELNPLHDIVTPMRGQWKESLQAVLEASAEECLNAARHEFQRLPALLENLRQAMRKMASHNGDYFGTGARWADELFPKTSDDVLKHCVRYFHDRYDFYDAATFPITYGTDVGILKTADVYRISPVDATEIIDESTDKKRRKKLAGDSLSAFGAFFQDSWRENDIMWGRLDGAERIISILLPGQANERLRKRFIAQAHLSIITDTLQKAKIKQVQSAFVKQLVGGTSADVSQAEKENAAKALLTPDKLLEYLKSDYAVDRTYQPSWTLPIAARAAKIMGQLLTFLSDEHRWQAPAIPMAVRVSRFVWATVEVAVPGSIAYASFAWFAGLLLFSEFVLLILGIWVVPGLTQIASSAIAVTLIAGVTVQLLHGYMSGEEGLFRLLRALFIFACVLVGLGIAVVGIHDLPAKLLTAPALLDKLKRTGPGLRTALGVSSAMTIVFGLLCQFPRFSQASRRSVAAEPRSPTLAMELSSTADQVRGLLSTASDRWSMRLVQFLDFGLIVAYGLFFTALAAYEFPLPWRIVAAAGGLMAWITAALDFDENVRILHTLDVPNGALNDEPIGRTRKISLAKWFCFALTLLLLSPGLLLRAAWGPEAGGVVCVLAGVTGVLGIFHHQWLRASVSLFACLVLGFLMASLLVF